ncbi:MAG: hypothetical protein LC753_02225 [Acidobacteria bacterium]|nr:hypothetical protein [Acidobacteriota bacterium]MCA1649121.1 hypothetical protein [Acidobacteriota bacterium]
MKRIVALGLTAALSAACGSKEEKQAEQAQQQAAQTAEKGAAEAAKGLEQMAKGLEAMAGGGSGDAKPVNPVSFRDMQALFPDLDGWEKAKPIGERMSSPFSYSQAEVAYTKGDSRLELKMVDSGFNQLLLTPYAMFLQAGYEKETSDGYEKSTTVNGQPGWEKWNAAGKDGELNALVGKRFLVRIEGRQIEDTKVLHDLAGRIDMGKLAALK